MRATFFGFEIARRALFAEQRALDVTGHNIANANTPGFSRQEAVLRATEAYTVPGWNRPLSAGQVGTGVAVQEIRRYRDQFIDGQWRKENQLLGKWDTKKFALEKIEALVNEPSEAGITTVLEQFWEGLAELAKKPADQNVRAIVVQRSIALTEAINHTYNQLDELQADIVHQAGVKVSEVNSLAEQIARLNDQIHKIELAGDSANDLRDQRGVLIDQLSSLASIQISHEDRGLLTIRINGIPLIDGNTVQKLELKEYTSGADKYYRVVWAGTDTEAQLRGGELAGLLELSQSHTTPPGIIETFKAKLNDFAKALHDEVNNIHQSSAANPTYDLKGQPGGEFFTYSASVTGQEARFLTVNPALIANPDLIAAAAIPAVGDGSIALRLAQLQNTRVTIGSGAAAVNSTLDSYLESVIGELGVQSQEAIRMADNQKLLVEQIDNYRQSVSGINLDEEMANMVKYQHSYNAAAKLLNVMDEMLQVLINQIGR